MSIQTFHHDGRQSPVERGVVLEDFNIAQGCRVLIASRGAGSQGLNLQSANVIIRCGPWWKVAWEEQADGRDEKSSWVSRGSIHEVALCLRLDSGGLWAP
jgi:SNF2 family DNA or RNA helicase